MIPEAPRHPRLPLSLQQRARLSVGEQFAQLRKAATAEMVEERLLQWHIASLQNREYACFDQLGFDAWYACRVGGMGCGHRPHAGPPGGHAHWDGA